jgi:hypothetical protein
VLLLGICSWLLFKLPAQKYQLIFFLLITVIALILSVTTRKDINLFNPNQPQIDLVSTLITTGQHLLFQPQGEMMVTPFAAAIFMAVISAGMWHYWGLSGMFVMLWVIGVIGMSVLSRGYSYYAIDFRLHRSLIIFPILVFFVLSFIVRQCQKMFPVLFCLSLLSFFGVFHTYLFLQKLPLSLHMQLFNHLHQTFPLIKNLPSSQLILDNKLASPLMSLRDSFQYLLPGSQIVIVENPCEFQPPVDAKTLTILFLSQTNHLICHQSLITRSHFQGEYRYLPTESYYLYELLAQPVN